MRGCLDYGMRTVQARVCKSKLRKKRICKSKLAEGIGEAKSPVKMFKARAETQWAFARSGFGGAVQPMRSPPRTTQPTSKGALRTRGRTSRQVTGRDGAKGAKYQGTLSRTDGLHMYDTKGAHRSTSAVLAATDEGQQNSASG